MVIILQIFSTTSAGNPSNIPQFSKPYVILAGEYSVTLYVYTNHMRAKFLMD